MFTNVLVEPNCVNWDVEKWWVNRPAALALVGGVMGADGVIRPLQGHGTSGTLTLEELELRAEAERIQLAKGSSVSSMLAAGAGYAKKPTLSVSISVHLAEMETVADPSAVVSYFVKIKRGVKKHTTDGAKATPVETLVSVGQDSSGAHSRGSSIGGDSDDDRAPLGGRSPGRTPLKELFHDAKENGKSGRSASAAGTKDKNAQLRRKSDFPEAYGGGRTAGKPWRRSGCVALCGRSSCDSTHMTRKLTPRFR